MKHMKNHDMKYIEHIRHKFLIQKMSSKENVHSSHSRFLTRKEGMCTCP